MSLVVKGTTDIYALGDCATIDQGELLSKWMDLFDKLDTNKDGFVDEQEWDAFVQEYGRYYPSLFEVARKGKALFHEGDVNSDGKLSHEEFQAILNQLDSQLTRLPSTATVAVQQGKFLGERFNEGQHLIKDRYQRDPFQYKHFGGFEYVGAQDGLRERGSASGNVVSGVGAWWLWRSVLFRYVACLIFSRSDCPASFRLLFVTYSIVVTELHFDIG